MADIAGPNTDPGAVEARAPRPRRRAPVPPRAQAATRRTGVVQFVIFALAAIITIDAVVGEKGLLQTFRARREYTQLMTAIDTLRRDNARMRERARRLREDPAAIEEAARRDLGLVRPGEILVIVRDAGTR